MGKWRNHDEISHNTMCLPLHHTGSGGGGPSHHYIPTHGLMASTSAGRPCGLSLVRITAHLIILEAKLRRSPHSVSGAGSGGVADALKPKVGLTHRIALESSRTARESRMDTACVCRPPIRPGPHIRWAGGGSVLPKECSFKLLSTFPLRRPVAQKSTPTHTHTLAALGPHAFVFRPHAPPWSLEAAASVPKARRRHRGRPPGTATKPRLCPHFRPDGA